MFNRLILTISFLATAPALSEAQCYGRNICDPELVEIRSQLTITIPTADSATQTEKMKAMDDASKSLQGMASRECDSMKTSIAGDCSISQININSSLQERGNRTQSAFASVNLSDLIVAPLTACKPEQELKFG